MEKNKKELILESFQKMDMNMLHVLLDGSITYQNAEKETFLEKIEEAFKKFNSIGDTFIHAFKGFCNSEHCSNKGCTGYSFIGNTSKKHIDLIFKESENDIADIFHCSIFQTNDEIGEVGALIYLDISKDEKVDSLPSIDYLIEDQKFNDAVEEILQHQHEIIGKITYSLWLEKHNLLFRSFLELPNFYCNLVKFYRLYRSIQKAYNYSIQEESAEEAVSEYPNSNILNEMDLLIWLATYEQLGLKLTDFVHEDIKYMERENNAFFEVCGLKISTEDYHNIIKFKYLFDTQYWEMLDKYSTFTEEDMSKINEDVEIFENWDILSYHMEKREMLD